ncbi:DUF4870 domain-containing protein [Microbacterium sp.]|uniref:DUF4870 domain-containing protein n=1 Tax=Microbacterium sp. TaxID=51671 RepID=UPI002C933E08|nr:DUF4870 domain-containing protein [Microbacterium sp.]HWL77605.1 DUF4870 domain-containing protein [Microbacterium sp.]
MTIPPSPQPPAGGYSAPPPSMTPADEKLWSTLVHLGGLFFGFLAPLIGYLILKDRGPFVRAHTATALNFQLTLIIAYIVGGLLTIVFVGIFIIFAAYILNIVFCIVAAVKANAGQWYTYPMSIPFVK